MALAINDGSCLTQFQETCAFSQCFRKFREYLTLQSEKGGSWNR